MLKQILHKRSAGEVPGIGTLSLDTVEGVVTLLEYLVLLGWAITQLETGWITVLKINPQQGTEIPSVQNTLKLQSQEFKAYVDISKFRYTNWCVLLGMIQKPWVKEEWELTYWVSVLGFFTCYCFLPTALGCQPSDVSILHAKNEI